MGFPEMYGGETFKQGRKNVFRMLVGILNKNDLHMSYSRTTKTGNKFNL